jgi:hypothetical protein
MVEYFCLVFVEDGVKRTLGFIIRGRNAAEARGIYQDESLHNK